MYVICCLLCIVRCLLCVVCSLLCVCIDCYVLLGLCDARVGCYSRFVDLCFGEVGHWFVVCCLMCVGCGDLLVISILVRGC